MLRLLRKRWALVDLHARGPIDAEAMIVVRAVARLERFQLQSSVPIGCDRLVSVGRIVACRKAEVREHRHEEGRAGTASSGYDCAISGRPAARRVPAAQQPAAFSRTAKESLILAVDLWYRRPELAATGEVLAVWPAWLVPDLDHRAFGLWHRRVRLRR